MLGLVVVSTSNHTVALKIWLDNFDMGVTWQLTQPTLEQGQAQSDSSPLHLATKAYLLPDLIAV
jgi:hypothetical protein